MIIMGDNRYHLLKYRLEENRCFFFKYSDGFFLIFYQVGGLIAMLASFYLLAQGWAMATYSPFYILLHNFLFLKLELHQASVVFHLFQYPLEHFLWPFPRFSQCFFFCLLWMISIVLIVNLTWNYHGKIALMLRFRQNECWVWTKW